MELEKEVRYSINKEQMDLIIKETSPLKEKSEMLDITCGYEGFNSYAKYKYICRIRLKGNKKTLEVKNYKNDCECVEQHIELSKVSDGVNYLKLIGMTPYLYLKRDREVRKYKDLKIFIDEFDILGDFVEIEYQDSNDVINELNEFLELIKITEEPKKMYGDLVKEKLENDNNFKIEFEQELNNILKEY